MSVEPSPSSVWRLVSSRATPIVARRVASGAPFYCIHPVAGDIATYDKLFQLLDPRQGLYGIQVPMASMRGNAVRSVAELAQGYAAAIAVHQPSGAVMLGGYSAGAVIALEVAQCLQRAGREVGLLVAIDGAPLNSGAELNPWHPQHIVQFVANLPRWLCSRKLREWTPKGIRKRVVNRLVFRASGRRARTADGAPLQHVAIVAGVIGRAGWKAEQIAFIRSLYDALHAYVPRPYSGRVLVFEAQISPLFAVAQTGRIWAALTPACDRIQIRAHHENLLAGGAATQTLARHLNRVLAEMRCLVSCPLDSSSLAEQSATAGTAGSVQAESLNVGSRVSLGEEHRMSSDPVAFKCG